MPMFNVLLLLLLDQCIIMTVEGSRFGTIGRAVTIKIVIILLLRYLSAV